MNNFHGLTRPKLLLLVTIFILVTGNQTFLSAVLDVYPLAQGNRAFIASLLVILSCLMFLVALLISTLLPVRVVATLLHFIAAGSGYFADQFGTVIDTSMLQNALETDSNEAADLMTWGFAQRFFLVGLLPAVLVWLCPLVKRPTLTEARFHIQTLVASLAVIAVLLNAYSSQYASFFREHKPVRYYANPLYPLYSMIKFSAEAGAAPRSSKVVMKTAPDAFIPTGHSGRELVVMVVGETARADRFSLNGYSRKTNPKLEKIENIVKICVKVKFSRKVSSYCFPTCNIYILS